MRIQDTLQLALNALTTYRMRSALTALGIAIGVASVVLLTAIGEGTHRFVLSEFTQFGTHLLGVTPGKTSTTGMSGAVISNVRPLTLEDAESLKRLHSVRDVVPLIQGNAAVEGNGHSRRTTVFGVGHAAPTVWQFGVSQGQFLPDDDAHSSRALAVLGAKLRQELFGRTNPLGKHIRVGGHRYKVIGVMESKGQLLGFDLDDAIYLPAAKTMEMFNRESLMEIDILYSPNVSAEHISEQVRQLLISRHGSEDFTIVTQEQMLETLSSILDILTLAVSAIGAISLLVGGIGILTILTIAVNERINEIGLFRALGASRNQVLTLYLYEAITIGAVGGLIGLALGVGLALLLSAFIPGLPVHISSFYVLTAEGVAILIGLLAGILPARKAASLDPVIALRTE